MAPSQPRLGVGMLKDERVAEEFVTKFSGGLRGLGVSGDHENIWSAFRTTILNVARRVSCNTPFSKEKLYLPRDTVHHLPELQGQA